MDRPDLDAMRRDAGLATRPTADTAGGIETILALDRCPRHVLALLAEVERLTKGWDAFGGRVADLLDAEAEKSPLCLHSAGLQDAARFVREATIAAKARPPGASSVDAGGPP